MEIPKINWFEEIRNLVLILTAIGVFYKLISELIKGNVEKVAKKAEVSKGVKEAHEKLQLMDNRVTLLEDKEKLNENQIITNTLGLEKVRDLVIDIARRKSE